MGNNNFQEDHNLPAIPTRMQLVQYAARQLLETGSINQTVELIRQAKIRSSLAQGITGDVALEQVLSGRPFVGKYDRLKIEIGSDALGGSGFYLLTERGAFLHGRSPVAETRDVVNCERLLQIVVRHDPQLGGRLKVLAA